MYCSAFVPPSWFDVPLLKLFPPCLQELKKVTLTGRWSLLVVRS